MSEPQIEPVAARLFQARSNDQPPQSVLLFPLAQELGGIASLPFLGAEYCPDIIMVNDTDGIILYANPSIQKVAEWSPAEIKKKPYIEWVHPADRLRALQAFEACRRGEVAATVEWRFLCQSGGYLWLGTKISTVKADKNAPLMFVLSSRDITVRKNFEASLLKSEERFRRLIENSPLGVAIIRNSKFIYVSREGAKILDYDDPDELLGNSIARLVAPSQMQALMELYTKKAKGIATSSYYEVQGIRKDGTEIPLQLNAAAIQLTDGPAAICYYRDLTDKKRAENALRESMVQLKFSLLGSGDGFFDWNMETGHVVYGSTYLEPLGYEEKDFPPHYSSWEALLHPEDKPSVLQILQSHLDGKTDFYESEHRLRTKSGDYLWVCARGKVTKRAKNGKPLRMNGTHHSISEKKRLEAELQSQKDSLEVLVKERTAELQEANVALKFLMKQSELNTKEMESIMLANINGALMPNISKLRNSSLNSNQRAILDIVEQEIGNILSPFLKHLGINYPGFTPQEVQIANLVKNGKTSKDIAEQLHLSLRTVDLLRYRIRKKLKINNTNANLETFLSAI